MFTASTGKLQNMPEISGKFCCLPVVLLLGYLACYVGLMHVVYVMYCLYVIHDSFTGRNLCNIYYYYYWQGLMLLTDPDFEYAAVIHVFNYMYL